MEDGITRLDGIVLDALRAAGEPVREAVLYERVVARGSDAGPERFLAALERLAELGHAHVAFDRELPAHDPDPFQPRAWRVIE
jgi:hypothetical protein